MQAPCTCAAEQEGVAELLLAGVKVGNITERAVEGVDAGGAAGINEAGDGVVPEVLLGVGARAAVCMRIFEHAVEGMAAADAGGFHLAACGKVCRAEADALHAGGGEGNVLDAGNAFSRFEDGVEEDRARETGLGLQLGNELVRVMDVPRAFDLRDHDHVELVAGLQHEVGHIVEEPGGVQAVDAAPEAGAGFLPVDHVRHLDGARAGGVLGVGGDRVFEVGEQHIDLLGHFRDLGPDLLVMAGDEMDHPLEADRQVAHRFGRANRERLEEIARRFLRHAAPPFARKD